MEGQIRVYIYSISRACAFLYLKFDALWPLDNSDVKDLTKMNREVCIESASEVDE